MGLRSELSCRYRPTTDSSHKEAIAENLLNRDFSSCSYDMKCVSDITYLPTNDVFLCLTIVMDLFNRDIIGWSLNSNMTAQYTVIAALNKAAKNSLFQDGMKTAIFEYIEIWYRKQRRHSYLGYQTIIEFNNKYNKHFFKYTA